MKSSHEKLYIFIDRLNKLGINIELWSNYPWMYITKINNKPVIETFKSEHGFVIGYSPIRPGQEFSFTEISETFKLIRKYI